VRVQAEEVFAKMMGEFNPYRALWNASRQKEVLAAGNEP